MFKTPAWIKLHIMLACALLFAGCVHADIAETPEIHVPSAAAATEKVYKDTLVFARPEAPGVFDPVLGDDTATTRLYHSIIPGLVQVSEQGEIVPDLAESWETSEDGLEWTFHLRPGLRFSDGSPVTADDWAFTFERAKSTGESPWSFTARDIADIRGNKDDLILTLSQEDPAFLASLTLFNMGLQSRAHFDALGGTYEEGWPLGAGAYQISARNDDGTLILDANPYYYKEGYPKTACIRIEKVAEDSDRVLLLQDGRADLISDIPYSGAAYTDLTEGIDVLEFPSTLCRYLVMNGEAQPALADPRVRQALVMATDFDELITACLYGYGRRSNSYLSPVTPAYHKDLKEYPYDPDRARALLLEAGYDGDLEIDFCLRKGLVLFEQIGVKIQEQWARIGVKVNIVPMEAEMLREKQYDMQLDMVIGTWTEDIPDPSGFTEYLLDFENTRGFYTGWRSEKARELFEEARYEMDSELRSALFDEIQQIVHDEAVLPALFCSDEIVACREELEGYSQTPYGQYVLENVTVWEEK